MATFATIVPPVADLADGFKYALGGIFIGVAFAGASEAVGNWVTHLAELDTASSATNRSAGLVLRSTSAAAFFMAGDRMLDALGRTDADPTGGLFFHIAFMLGQPKLISAIIGTAGLVTKQTTKALGLACCADCAESGGSCGKK